MLIAHLPSGYILGMLLKRRKRVPGVVLAAMVGSVLPDADMLYFHLIDQGRVHHHDYPTHWPLFWIAAAVVTVPLVRLSLRPWLSATSALFAGALLHMGLDTVAAPIKWLMPFSSRSFELVEVPAIYSHWIVSFVLHWTFLVELTICAVALAFFLYRGSFSYLASNRP